MSRFRHIYVERRIADTQRTKDILARFPDSRMILIDSYKAVFNRRGQDAVHQHAQQNLILAGARERNVYPGAPVCQDFGNRHFYYTSCAMNCLYDCEYCYLKGMYPSGNLVVFTQLEKIMQEVEDLLQQFPVYLCISYDTDLLAMEDLLHYVEQWADFAAAHGELTVEIRTKCAGRKLFRRLAERGWPGADRLIFAYTISPDEVIRAFEHGTPGLAERLGAAAECLRTGGTVRLCFDPMIYLPGWKADYTRMLEETAAAVPLGEIRDFSIGSFRISESYLRSMRRSLPYSAIVQYPYVLEQGYYHYPDRLCREMEDFLEKALRAMVPDAAVYRWEEQDP